MKFDERIDGDYRIYAGALDVLTGDGYIAAVVVNRVVEAKAKTREVFRDESLACGHRWKSADEALMFALCKAREWIAVDRQHTSDFCANLTSGSRALRSERLPSAAGGAVGVSAAAR